MANRIRTSAEITHPADREIATLVQPEVALHQSRVGNTRRQFARLVERSLYVVAGDGIAIAAVSATVNAAARAAASRQDIVFPTVGVGQVCVAMLVCLALTGNYQRSSPSQLHFRLLTGAALGAIVVYWPSVWSAHALLAIPLAAILLLAASLALRAMRLVSAALVVRLVPEVRRLAPAIVLTADAGTPALLPPEAGYRIAGSMVMDWRHSDARMRDLARLIRRTRAESVIMYGQVNSVQLAGIAEISLRAGCEFLAAAPAQTVQGVRSSFVWRGPCSFMRSEAPKLEAPQLLAKRCVDVVGSLVALVAGAPVCALVALAIRLDSPGPIFFQQERVGLGGRRFQMLKFRTMYAGADREKVELEHLNASGDRRLFKIPNDPRISRVGRFLRQWSLDELPQFVNVLTGQMSLVGPRPFFEDDFV
ncbi:MAG: sugar transferase, partial [Gemmatimonadota bacterium]|nr:sugar transferase [Gemmatimonadota bacterium]